MHSSEFMGEKFQAAQLTHERFLTIDHSCKIFFWYLPNWTFTDLWCVVLYVIYSTTHQRLVEVQLGRYRKNILQEWSMVKNLSCVRCAAWNVFPINSLLQPTPAALVQTWKNVFTIILRLVEVSCFYNQNFCLPTKILHTYCESYSAVFFFLVTF